MAVAFLLRTSAFLELCSSLLSVWRRLLRSIRNDVVVSKNYKGLRNVGVFPVTGTSSMGVAIIHNDDNTVMLAYSGNKSSRLPNERAMSEKPDFSFNSTLID